MERSIWELLAKEILPTVALIMGGAWAVFKIFLQRMDKRLGHTEDHCKICLNKVILPLEQKLPQIRPRSTENAVKWLKNAKQIYKENVLLVPCIHVEILDKVMPLCTKYLEAKNQKYKALLQDEIDKTYYKFRALFINYSNEIKKTLGYQYDSLWMQFKYSRLVPHTELVLYIFTISVFLVIYLVLLSLKIYVAVVIVAMVLMLSLVLYIIWKEVIEVVGGWKIYWFLKKKVKKHPTDANK